MATFGYTTVGGSSVYFNAPGSLCLIGSGLIFSPSSQYSRVKKLWIYGSGTSVQLAIYDISGGLPVNRLAAGVTVNLPGVAAWTSVNVNFILINGKTYGLAEGAANNATVYYDTLTGTQRSNCSTDLPATWVSNGTTARAYSWYVEYETVQENIL